MGPVRYTEFRILPATMDEAWARIASLTGTRKLNVVNPEAYIAATLCKILNNHMRRDTAELKP
jgi:transposase